MRTLRLERLAVPLVRLAVPSLHSRPCEPLPTASHPGVRLAANCPRAIADRLLRPPPLADEAERARVG